MKKNEYDVAIFGGGPAGIACAYNAGKLGLKTVLIEKNNYLGGQITGALVVPMMKSSSDNINVDFFNALVEYSKKYNAQATYMDGNDGWFNPVILKIVFEKMLSDVGVDILYNAQISDAKTVVSNNKKYVEFAEINANTLSLHFYSKYFVDATGDSKFCEILNCNFIDDKEKFQPSSLRFIISGVNLEKFASQILKLDKDREVTTSFSSEGQIHLSTAYTFDTNRHWGLAPLFKKALDNGDLEYIDTAYFQVFTMPGMPDSLAFNCPRLQNNNDNAFGYSNSLIKAREVIFRLFKFVQKYFDGCDRAYISQIADMTGVRVSKRPKTRYIYKISDILSSKTFDNSVLAADYPIDIHSNDENSSTLHCVKKYYLPIESLISADYQNLFVAGRNVGAEFEAQAALRIQKSCLSMGEGVAKYIKSSQADST